MPRELTHWLIAERAAGLLPPASVYGEAARLFPSERSLGAVIHDALFYAPAGARPHAWVADLLHGEDGGDTFETVRGLHREIARLRDRGSPLVGPLAAFTLGVLSHVVADATLHPFVYYHSGLPGPGGRLPPRVASSHRRLETLVDVLLVGWEGIARGSLLAHRAAVGGRLDVLLSALAGAIVAEQERPGLVRALGLSLDRFVRAQSLFRLRGAMAAAWTIRRLLPWDAREVVALGYAPPSAEEARRLAGEIAYRHPVTGEPSRASLEELAGQAASAAAHAVEFLDADLAAPPRARAPLTPPCAPAPREADRAAIPEAGRFGSPLRARGPALASGLPGVPASALRHAAPRPIVE